MIDVIKIDNRQNGVRQMGLGERGGESECAAIYVLYVRLIYTSDNALLLIHRTAVHQCLRSQPEEEKKREKKTHPDNQTHFLC